MIELSKKSFPAQKKLDKNVWSNGMKIRVPGRKKQNNVKFTTPKITLKKKGTYQISEELYCTDYI